MNTYTKEHLLIDVEYNSGPLFSQSDVHAGGLLFGFVYEERLLFHRNGTIQVSCSVLETFVQMEHESAAFAQKSVNSRYSFTDRGYLTFELPDRWFYGTCCSKNSRMLALHMVATRRYPDGRVYTACEG